MNRQLESRDQRVRELMAAHEVAKLEAERHSTLVTSLRQCVAECEWQHSGLEDTRRQLALLQQQYHDSQQLITQLNAQIRLQLG